MSITIDAIYENGVLKPERPLPLHEHEKVHLTIVPAAPSVQAALEAVERSYGMVRWTGDPEILRRVAEDDEFGILESP